jgi:hypothetical protein
MGFTARIRFKASTSGRMPGGAGSCSETAALGCRRCGDKPENSSSHGPSGPDGRGALGGNLGPFDSRSDDRLHGGLNSLFSAAKRKVRGYRAVEYMTAVLYFVAGKLTLPCYLPTESSEEPLPLPLLLAD